LAQILQHLNTNTELNIIKETPMTNSRLSNTIENLNTLNQCSTWEIRHNRHLPLIKGSISQLLDVLEGYEFQQNLTQLARFNYSLKSLQHLEDLPTDSDVSRHLIQLAFICMDSSTQIDLEDRYSLRYIAYLCCLYIAHSNHAHLLPTRLLSDMWATLIAESEEAFPSNTSVCLLNLELSLKITPLIAHQGRLPSDNTSRLIQQLFAFSNSCLRARSFELGREFLSTALTYVSEEKTPMTIGKPIEQLMETAIKTLQESMLTLSSKDIVNRIEGIYEYLRTYNLVAQHMETRQAINGDILCDLFPVLLSILRVLQDISEVDTEMHLFWKAHYTQLAGEFFVLVQDSSPINSYMLSILFITLKHSVISSVISPASSLHALETCLPILSQLIQNDLTPNDVVNGARKLAAMVTSEKRLTTIESSSARMSSLLSGYKCAAIK
jgi:hypothetical protein